MQNMYEYLNNKDIDYKDIAVYIPDVMNALFNEQAGSKLHQWEIRNAFRIKMMQSKAWLIQQFISAVVNPNSNILVVGGWLGFTSWVLYKYGYSNITEIDVDQRLHDFSCHLNRFNKNFIHLSKDVNDIDTSKYEVIINSSCEHIDNPAWFYNSKSGCLQVLQSNNIEISEHVNICKNLDHMISKYPLNLKYSGTLDYNDGTQRFMLVGYK